LLVPKYIEECNRAADSARCMWLCAHCTYVSQQCLLENYSQITVQEQRNLITQNLSTVETPHLGSNTGS